MRDFKAENIANVTVGDFILTSSGFSQVFAFTHNDPIPSAKYLRISTEGTGEPLEVSEEHIIFKDQNGRRVPVQAREIREGDVVYVVTNSNKEGTIVRTIHWESTLSEGEMPLFRALKVSLCACVCVCGLFYMYLSVFYMYVYIYIYIYIYMCVCML
ncbi:hypothetical protein AAMO2058_000648300 [Amorphochlora amoebiformis]